MAKELGTEPVDEEPEPVDEEDNPIPEWMLDK